MAQIPVGGMNTFFLSAARDMLNNFIFIYYITSTKFTVYLSLDERSVHYSASIPEFGRPPTVSFESAVIALYIYSDEIVI